MKPNIYDYKDPITFLEAYYAFLKISNPPFSIRKWCKDLGISSPEFFMSCLKRKKNLNHNLVKDIAQGLSLDSQEQAYLEILINLSNATSAREKQLFEMLLAEAGHLRGHKILVEDNSVFSHWVHMAILTMSRIKNIHCTKDTIREYLREPVSQDIINESVDRLLALNLVSYDENGSLKRHQDHTTSKNDAFQKSPHNYFEQVSELAIKGSQVPADEREFQCFSLAINHDQMALFKETIRNFRAKVAALADTNNSDQVYQFNIQFFPLTNQVTQPQLKMNGENVSAFAEQLS